MLNPRPFRYYMVFNSIWFAAGTPLLPFIIYYLNSNVGYTDGSLILYTGIMYLGCIISAYLTRGKMDSKGPKPYLLLSLYLCAALKLFWILVLFKIPFFVSAIPIGFFINGFGHVLWQVAHFKYVPTLCKKEDRSLGVALQMAISGLSGGLSAILWGYILNSPHPHTPIQMHTFSLYLYFSFAVFIALILPCIKLSSKGSDISSQLPFASDY